MLTDVHSKYIGTFGKTYIAKVASKKYITDQPILKMPFLTADTVEISQTIPNHFAQRIHELSQNDYESETLKKLFTSKYKPQRRTNELGFPVTTLIYKATGEPIEVYVKSENTDKNKKKYVFYKDDEIKPIGQRSFEISSELKIINPGYMSSYNNNEFGGLGIRCHQLAVEQTILNKLDKIIIEAIPNAATFHKKCLFKNTNIICMTKNDFERMIWNLQNENMLEWDEILKKISYEEKNDIIYLNYMESKPNIEGLMWGRMDDYMELSGERLQLWQDMAKSQPILL